MTSSPVAVGFDLDARWTLDRQVSVRPEPFGALLYHFGTRRLSFLKDPRLHVVVTTLDGHPTARDACLAAGVQEPELPDFTVALTRLATSQMIHPSAPGLDVVQP